MAARFVDERCLWLSEEVSGATRLQRPIRWSARARTSNRDDRRDAARAPTSRPLTPRAARSPTTTRSKRRHPLTRAPLFATSACLVAHLGLLPAVCRRTTPPAAPSVSEPLWADSVAPSPPLTSPRPSCDDSPCRTSSCVRCRASVMHRSEKVWSLAADLGRTRRRADERLKSWAASTPGTSQTSQQASAAHRAALDCT